MQFIHCVFLGFSLKGASDESFEAVSYDRDAMEEDPTHWKMLLTSC